MLEKEIEEYLGFLKKEKDISRNTELSYRGDLKKLDRFASGRGIRKAGDLDGALAEAFAAELREEGLSERTRARTLGCVRGFLAWLGESWRVSPSVAEDIRLPRTREGRVRILRPEEILGLVTAPDPSTGQGRRDRAILELLCSAGLRSAQLTALRVRDVDLQISCVVLRQKDGSERLLPFGERARRSLIRYLSAGRGRFRSPEDILFPARNGGQMSRQSLWKIVRKYALEAGIEGSVSPARLRATLAAELLDSGASLENVREIMGHADPSSTRRYKKQGADGKML